MGESSHIQKQIGDQVSKAPFTHAWKTSFFLAILFGATKRNCIFLFLKCLNVCSLFAEIDNPRVNGPSGRFTPSFDLFTLPTSNTKS